MKNNILALFLLALTFTSCIEEIDLELDRAEYEKLIVEGEITDQQGFQTVKLSRTSAYDSNVPCPPATGAQVSVSIGDKEYTLPEVSPGVYQSDQFIGEVGKVHTLSVLYGNEHYTASSTMQPVMVLDSVGFKKFPFGVPQDLPHWEILVYAQDNPDRNDCQLIQYSINGEWQDTLLYAGFFADWISNGQYINGERVAIYASREEAVEVKLRSVSIEEQFLWFVDNLIWAVMPDMFFSPPRANIKGNISNGALGFFRASAVYETDVYVLTLSGL